MKYCITCSVLYIYIIIFAATVKSQQNIMCYEADTCDISQPTQSIDSDDSVSECCNYPRAGVRPKGLAYQVAGQEGCTLCPKSMLSIDTSCSNYLLEMLSTCNVTRSFLS